MISDMMSDSNVEIETEHETNLAFVDGQNQANGSNDCDLTVMSSETHDVGNEIKQVEATLEETKEITGAINIGTATMSDDGCPHTYIIDGREKKLLAKSSKVKKCLAREESFEERLPRKKKKGFRSFIRQLFTGCYKRV
ncbi:uncharacterized protein [Parasteatoda tepidariorum]|uniref:uncharacterized protein n=1 Tax=Parasteatoda tepidariorum TaxID=114398 RepID=UPI0039BCEE64